MKALSALLVLVLAAPLLAQDRRQPSEGPYTHVVLSATSPDGLRWTRDEGVRIEHASVPCALATRDGKVMLYFVDASGEGPEQINCATSADGIHFEKQGLTIEGCPSEKSVDPSVLLADDGTFLLYYFASSPGRQREDAHEIHRATSKDGVHFAEQGAAFTYAGLVDPDVFRWKDRWFMYVFAGRRTVVARSKDGVAFDYAEDLSLKGWGTVAPIPVGDKLRLYAFDQRARSANEIHSFVSTDGLRWSEEAGARLKAGANEQLTDPYVIRWGSGYKMYFKSQTPPAGPR